MGPLDRPAAREGLLSYRRRSEAPAEGERTEFANLYGDDPLAAAKGAVIGVLWGAVLWAVILLVLL